MTKKLDVAELLAAFADAHEATTKDECLSRQAALELAREHFAEALRPHYADDNIRGHLVDAGAADLAALSDPDVALRARLGAKVLEILADRETDISLGRDWSATSKEAVSDIEAAARSLGLLREEVKP